jgi:hypothetical protein
VKAANAVPLPDLNLLLSLDEPNLRKADIHSVVHTNISANFTFASQKADTLQGYIETACPPLTPVAADGEDFAKKFPHFIMSMQQLYEFFGSKTKIIFPMTVIKLLHAELAKVR